MRVILLEKKRESNHFNFNLKNQTISFSIGTSIIIS